MTRKQSWRFSQSSSGAISGWKFPIPLFFPRHFESESLERANEPLVAEGEGGGKERGLTGARRQQRLYTPAEYHPLAAEISRRDLISVERGEEIEEIASRMMRKLCYISRFGDPYPLLPRRGNLRIYARTDIFSLSLSPTPRVRVSTDETKKRDIASEEFGEIRESRPIGEATKNWAFKSCAVREERKKTKERARPYLAFLSLSLTSSG